MFHQIHDTARQKVDSRTFSDESANPSDTSSNNAFASAIRPGAIALLLAVASLTAACGSGAEGGSAEASTADSLSKKKSQSVSTNTVEQPVATTSGDTASAAEIPSGVAYSCAFETTFSDCGFSEQAKVPGRATMVTVAGVKSVRLHTEPGDTNVNGSGSHERNDLSLGQSRTDGYEGREQWWAHSVRFPDDYVDPPISGTSGWNFGLVANFHNTTSGAGQANFQVQAMPTAAISPDRPTGLSFQIAYGNQTSPTKQAFPIGPVVRNQWYNFVYHVKWTSGSDGYFDAWVNGVKKMSYRGPTLYSGQGVYLKLANYHSAYGQASSVIHSRVIRSNSALDVNAGL